MLFTRTALDEVERLEVVSERGVYVRGRTDGLDVPVYQTKWLKYGLMSLGVPDKYVVPRIQDAYSSLFWWYYDGHHVSEEGSLSGMRV